MKAPLIFDIARASFVDGPGVRTTVFVKGCPLSCPWCHNPEAQSPAREIMAYPEHCIRCGNCEKNMPCYTGARQKVGRPYGPEELAQILLEDNAYFDASGGGVTFSGGEPLSVIPFLSKTAQRLKANGIHIAVQTCGYFDFELFSARLLPYIDLVYFDLKIMDDRRHRHFLGKSNRPILDNFKRLNNSRIQIQPRIPLVPGYTATRRNLDAMARFLYDQSAESCTFLFYHPGGIEKRARLGKKNIWPLPENQPSKAWNRAWINYFEKKMTALKTATPVRVRP